MVNLTPYNLLLVVAAVVTLGLAALVYIFGNAVSAAGFVAFATPFLVVLTAVIQSYQNVSNHAENQARINDIEQRLPPPSGGPTQ